MSVMTILAVVAMLAVVGSLGLGVASMVTHGEVGHRTSEQWMTMRVGLQALAVVLLPMALAT